MTITVLTFVLVIGSSFNLSGLVFSFSFFHLIYFVLLESDIDGQCLLDLTESDLEALKLSLGHRIKLSNFIKKIKNCERRPTLNETVKPNSAIIGAMTNSASDGSLGIPASTGVITCPASEVALTNQVHSSAITSPASSGSLTAPTSSSANTCPATDMILTNTTIEVDLTNTAAAAITSATSDSALTSAASSDTLTSTASGGAFTTTEISEQRDSISCEVVQCDFTTEELMEIDNRNVIIFYDILSYFIEITFFSVK